MHTPVRSFKGIKPELGEEVYVDPTATILGDVIIGEDSSVWPCAVIRGDMHCIRIGARTSVQDGSVLHITHASQYNPDGYPLHIGSDVTIGHNAVLHGCTIEDRVLIGMGAIVMDGAHIEPNVILAAGSLVSPGKQLKRGWLYQGQPARPVRELSETELGYFTYSAANYVNLKNQYMTQE